MKTYKGKIPKNEVKSPDVRYVEFGDDSGHLTIEQVAQNLLKDAPEGTGVELIDGRYKFIYPETRNL